MLWPGAIFGTCTLSEQMEMAASSSPAALDMLLTSPNISSGVKGQPRS
jgi:hypothetical protein